MSKVLVGTPAYGGMVTAAYLQSTIGLIHASYDAGVQIDIMTLTNESLITRARNDIVARFLEGDWTDLLFIDSDIGFTAEHAFRLINADFDVACGRYAMKGLDWDTMSYVRGNPQALREASIVSVVNFIPEAQMQDGFAECLDAGTGFMRIKRHVLEKMIADYPELAYQTDKFGESGQRWALFDTMLTDGRYLSEDYAFCRRWQNSGGSIWVDVQSPVLEHQGSYVYGK